MNCNFRWFKFSYKLPIFGPSEPDQPFAGDIENTDQDDVTTHPDYPLTTLFKAMFTHQFGPEGGSHNSEKLGVLITVPKGILTVLIIEIYKRDKLQVPLRNHLKWRDVLLLEGPTLSMNCTSLSVLSTS